MSNQRKLLQADSFPDGIRLPCPRCSCVGSLHVGQSNFRGNLRWFESTNCEVCGLISEADGIGFPPESLRKLMIQENGEWEVLICDVKSFAIAAKVLQTALSIDMKEALALLRNDRQVVFTGTKTEAVWLTKMLEDAGESPVLVETLIPRSQPFLAEANPD